MERFERYWKLSEMEERFNSSSAGVRKLASGWMLASIAALGWLLEPGKEQTGWVIPLGLVLLAVCVLSTAGIATLWVMDQLVFHRLLNSVFLVGLRMEHADRSLPPIRALMIKRIEDEGTHRWERLFYLAPLLVFVLLSALIVTTGSDALFSSPRRDLLPDARWLGYPMLFVQIVIILWVLAKQRSVRFLEQAEWFGDEGFKKLVKAREFEKIISAWQPIDTTSEDEQTAKRLHGGAASSRP